MGHASSLPYGFWSGWSAQSPAFGAPGVHQHAVRYSSDRSQHDVTSKENPGWRRGVAAAEFLTLTGDPVFLAKGLSEMTNKPSVDAGKASEYCRESNLADVQAWARKLAEPVRAGENIKAQQLRAWRSACELLPNLKFSRFRDFWYADRRISVRGFEAEGIFARFDRLARAEITRRNANAGRALHEATAAAAAVHGDRDPGRAPGDAGRDNSDSGCDACVAGEGAER